MKNEDFNTKLNNRFESIRATVLDVLTQLFKHEFSIDQSLIGSGEPKNEIQNEDFPKVILQFKTTTPQTIQQVWMLPPGLVLNLYAWMVEMEADEAVKDEHLEGLKEGTEQIFGQIRAVLDGEGLQLDIEDLQLSMAESNAALDLEDAQAEGAVAAYTIVVEEQNYTVTQYLFADFSAMDDNKTEDALSEDEIENMLNGEAVDARVSIDDDLEEEVDVKQVEFGAFDDDAGMGSNGQPRNIDMLLEVDLEVLVELGRKTMLIKEVLKLGKGSVVELDKAAGEPLGIFVNGRKLAEGEVVVVDDHFGIRITQLAGTAERIKSLG
ncbi:MAG: flagellar motor switch protein FliN [Candidatus Marinimicrobia bacterium]|nr:flagellar motor switch protein FliN [Candidatus Neomarinimicrobiota bacterium]